MTVKAVKLTVRALVCLLVLATFGHWIEAVWLTRVAAMAMAGVLVTAGVVVMWADWGDKLEPPHYHIVWHGSCNNVRGENSPLIWGNRSRLKVCKMGSDLPRKMGSTV